MDIENAKNYIIAGFIALVMVLTNPKLDDHQAEFSLYLEQFGTNATSQNIWDELGSTIGSKLFSKFISIDNFILFSSWIINPFILQCSPYERYILVSVSFCTI